MGATSRLATASAILVLAAVTGLADAHSGGLDAHGCHQNRKTGDYHCHRAQHQTLEQNTVPATSSGAMSGLQPGAIRRSGAGICYDRGYDSWGGMVNYREFASL